MLGGLVLCDKFRVESEMNFGVYGFGAVVLGF